MKLAEEVARIARNLNDGVAQMPSRLTEAVFQRRSERERRERWRMAAGLLAMLVGGFLAGQIAIWRSGAAANPKPSAAEQLPSASKSAPAARHRPAGPGTKSSGAPAR